MRKRSLVFIVIALLAVVTLIFGMTRQTNHRVESTGEVVKANVDESEIRARAQHSYGKLPLVFEANNGQTNEKAKFISRSAGVSLFLMQDGATMALQSSKFQVSSSKSKASIVNLKFVGANKSPRIEGLEETPGKTNYLIGNDPKAWRTDIPNYAKVRYEEIYRGVDLIFHGTQQKLEYDFVVQPSSNPDTIALSFDGADEIKINEQGDLVLRVNGEELKHHKPFAYQEINGGKKEIQSKYEIQKPKTKDQSSVIKFNVGEYDQSKPLIIDPILSYSTYWGGTFGTGGFNVGDKGDGIAVDSSGNAYIVGSTTSNSFPTVNPFQTMLTGGISAFVAKINAAGTGFVYSTYLNGAAASGGGNTIGAAIAVNSAGNAYVTGITQACNLPTTPGAFLPAGSPLCGGNFKGFVSKLNTAGNGLDFSTYIADTNYNFNGEMRGIAVDAAGIAYLTGFTNVSTFPTTAGAFRPAPGAGSGSDTFVIKLNSNASGLTYSTFLGGGNTNTGDAFGLQRSIPTSIALDSSNNAVVAGNTTATNFPLLNTVQPGYTGFLDAFVTKLNANGTGLIFSTYLGGNGRDGEPINVVVDSANNVYLSTNTLSRNFPLTPTSFQPFVSTNNTATVLTKLNASGGLIYSTAIGFEANSLSNPNNVAVDTNGNPYLVGNGVNPIFPVTPLNLTPPPTQQNSIAKLNNTATAMIFGTYFNGGSSSATTINDLALDPSGNAYITGFTLETTFPTTAGAPQTTNQNPTLGNAFVSKISLVGGDCPAIAINPQPLRVGVRNQPYSQQLTASGGTASYNFSLFPNVPGSQFPSGIGISSSGLISGTYTGAPFISQVAVRATDANGCVGVRPFQLRFYGGVRPFDFDNDFKADISLFRPSNGVWYRLDSFRNISFQAVGFGINGDIPASGDFDGDGVFDISIYRPSTGTWWRIESLTGNVFALNFGLNDDIPTVGDFDGDGRSDIAVYRPSMGVWYLQQSQAGFFTIQFGLNGDRPVVGDYDGDGRSDICVWRPSDGNWYRLNSSNGQFVAVNFGLNGDIPVRGDFNNGGRSDLAVFRPSNGVWYFLYTENNQFFATQFGTNGDIPVPSDYDGDGQTDIGVWRPSTGVWYVIRSSNGSFMITQFGLNGDVPIAALP
jgi:hypothetical protein